MLYCRMGVECSALGVMTHKARTLSQCVRALWARTTNNEHSPLPPPPPVCVCLCVFHAPGRPRVHSPEGGQARSAMIGHDSPTTRQVSPEHHRASGTDLMRVQSHAHTRAAAGRRTTLTASSKIDAAKPQRRRSLPGRDENMRPEGVTAPSPLKQVVVTMGEHTFAVNAYREIGTLMKDTYLLYP